jgi:hypothetical protein
VEASWSLSPGRESDSPRAQFVGSAGAEKSPKKWMGKLPLRFETKSDLLTNTLDNRRNYRLSNS